MVTRQVRTLPPELTGILDFAFLAEHTGVDPSGLRRTAASFVRFTLLEAMPHQPQATLRFLHELQGLLIERHAFDAAVRRMAGDFRRLAREAGVELAEESLKPKTQSPQSKTQNPKPKTQNPAAAR